MHCLSVQLNALELQEKVADAIRQVDDKLNFNDTIQHEDNLLKLYRETMLQCYNFGFEVCACLGQGDRQVGRIGREHVFVCFIVCCLKCKFWR